MFEQHLTEDDMPLFTKLRMTAFGETVIDMANDPACDEWSFSQKIRHALNREIEARGERRAPRTLPPVLRTFTTSMGVRSIVKSWPGLRLVDG